MARVLIIDDDQDIREALAIVLESEGYEVAAASNGREGLDQACGRHPDVILLDLMMPVMDGWQFRAEQEKRPDIAAVPVVAISACGSRPEIGEARFIPKPCDIEVVLEAVRCHGQHTSSPFRAENRSVPGACAHESAPA